MESFEEHGRRQEKGGKIEGKGQKKNYMCSKKFKL